MVGLIDTPLRWCLIKRLGMYCSKLYCLDFCRFLINLLHITEIPLLFLLLFLFSSSPNEITQCTGHRPEAKPGIILRLGYEKMQEKFSYPKIFNRFDPKTITHCVKRLEIFYQNFNIGGKHKNYCPEIIAVSYPFAIPLR
jgi:hypothetical protein